MGSKYPILKPEQIIKVLEGLGFEKVSQRGGHVKYKKYGSNTKVVIIPLHNEIAKGTLKGILQQAGLDIDEFLKYL